jgi:hypothetical protein
MSVLFLIAAYLVGAAAALYIKDRSARAREWREDRVMAAYLEAEAARFHRQRLADIDARAQRTCDELGRIAAEAGSAVIEGSAIEADRP